MLTKDEAMNLLGCIEVAFGESYAPNPPPLVDLADLVKAVLRETAPQPIEEHIAVFDYAGRLLVTIGNTIGPG